MVAAIRLAMKAVIACKKSLVLYRDNVSFSCDIEIAASLEISSNSTHKILNEYLTLKKVCSRRIPYKLTEVGKDARVSLLVQTNAEKIQETCIRLQQVINRRSTGMNQKVNSSPLCFKMSQIQIKCCARSLQINVLFFGQTNHMATFRGMARSILNGTQPTFSCRKSSMK